MTERPILRNLEGRRGTEGVTTESYVKIPVRSEYKLPLWS